MIYSNSDTFISYEVPYNNDEKVQDVRELTRDNYMSFNDGPKCGIFMNAICKVLDQNANTGFAMNYSEIEDDIMDKVEDTVVPVWGNFDLKVGQLVWPSGSIRNRVKRKIVFGMSKEEGVVIWM